MTPPGGGKVRFAAVDGVTGRNHAGVSMYSTLLPAAQYSLEATLTSGQAFRWQRAAAGWEGVVAGRWVRLAEVPEGLAAEVAEPVSSWDWLEHYLQNRVDLHAILATFPASDRRLWRAVNACPGLRLLRQDPWECLASFLLSSTKQITQIQQIIACLCQRFGQPVRIPPGCAPAWSFPAPAVLAQAGEAALRECKMGFRARALREAAERAASGQLDLARLAGLPEAEARAALMDLRGVGPKIADCVLLFAYGFSRAFPVDVWVRRALREWYFPRRQPAAAQWAGFIARHFGPHAGYAQQYLFHYWRTQRRPARAARS